MVASKYLMEYHYHRSDPDSRTPGTALLNCVRFYWMQATIPGSQRAFRLLSVIRNCIGDFCDQGKYVAFPSGPEVQNESAMLDSKHCPKQRKRDAYELDGYIRSAAESSDLVEVYLRPFNTATKDRIRSFALPVQACIALMGGRFDWAEEQTGTEEADIWRSADAQFGEEVATVAYGVIKAYAELGRPSVATNLGVNTADQASGLQSVPKASGAGQAVPPEGQQRDVDMADAAGQARGAQETRQDTPSSTGRRSSQGPARSSTWNPSLPPGQAAVERMHALRQIGFIAMGHRPSVLARRRTWQRPTSVICMPGAVENKRGVLDRKLNNRMPGLMKTCHVNVTRARLHGPTVGEVVMHEIKNARELVPHVLGFHLHRGPGIRGLLLGHHRMEMCVFELGRN